MRVTVTAVVEFDVPDNPIEEIAQRFRQAHDMMIGIPMQTVTGQYYVVLAIHRLDVQRA